MRKFLVKFFGVFAVLSASLWLAFASSVATALPLYYGNFSPTDDIFSVPTLIDPLKGNVAGNRICSGRPVQSTNSGCVRTMALYGNRVFAGGAFRTRSGAFNVIKMDHLGNEDTTFKVSTDGEVRGMIVYNNVLYMVGKFKKVTVRKPDGTSVTQARLKIAAVSAVTGDFLTSFKPKLAGGEAFAIAQYGGYLYVGGQFKKVNDLDRSYFVRLNPNTGIIEHNGFNTTVDNHVYAIKASTSGLYIGGEFNVVNGIARQSLAVVNPSNGALGATVFNTNRSETYDKVYDIDVYESGGFGPFIYTAEEANRVAAYNANGGYLFTPLIYPHGNGQSVRYCDGMLYAGWHDGYTINGVRNSNIKMLQFNAYNGQLNANWQPSIDSSQGVWDITTPSQTDCNTLFVGGEFSTVNSISTKYFGVFRP